MSKPSLSAFGDYVSRRRPLVSTISTSRSGTFTIPSPFCREKGGAPAGHFAGFRVPPYLQNRPRGPLRLQLFEQQSAFVVQEEPVGKHPASVVVVALVVAVGVVGGA